MWCTHSDGSREPHPAAGGKECPSVNVKDGSRPVFCLPKCVGPSVQRLKQPLLLPLLPAAACPMPILSTPATTAQPTRLCSNICQRPLIPYNSRASAPTISLLPCYHAPQQRRSLCGAVFLPAALPPRQLLQCNEEVPCLIQQFVRRMSRPRVTPRKPRQSGSRRQGAGHARQRARTW